MEIIQILLHLLYFLLPASIGTFIIETQFKDLKLKYSIYIYLINTILINTLAYNVTWYFFDVKDINFLRLDFTCKYLLLCCLMSFILGVFWSIVCTRFNLKIEVKDEKDGKNGKNIKSIKNSK